MEIGLSHPHVICFGDQSSGTVILECVDHNIIRHAKWPLVSGNWTPHTMLEIRSAKRLGYRLGSW